MPSPPLSKPIQAFIHPILSEHPVLTSLGWRLQALGISTDHELDSLALMHNSTEHSGLIACLLAELAVSLEENASIRSALTIRVNGAEERIAKWKDQAAALGLAPTSNFLRSIPTAWTTRLHSVLDNDASWSSDRLDRLAEALHHPALSALNSLEEMLRSVQRGNTPVFLEFDKVIIKYGLWERGRQLSG